MLVHAPSNKAVMVCLEKFLQTYNGDSCFHPPDDIALIGVEEMLLSSAQSPHVIDKYYAHCQERNLYESISQLKNLVKEKKKVKQANGSAAALESSIKLEMKRITLKITKISPDFLLLCDTNISDDVEEFDILSKPKHFINHIEEKISTNSFADLLIQNCSITFSTLGSCVQLQNVPSPDVLIVDEAAQCLEGEMLCALMRHPKRILIIGDPAQLPATMISTEARRLGHARSLMERLMRCAASEENSRKTLSMLKTQYRMHPEIVAFPSHQFYDGKLSTAEFLILQEDSDVLPTLPAYSIFDISSGKESSELESKKNRREAGIAVQIVKTIRS